MIKSNIASTLGVVEVQHQNTQEIDVLVRLFIDKQLPYEKWTHTAHLMVGLWSLTQFKARQAADFLRTHIKAYNEAMGIKNSDSSGYHETITLFWIWVIDNFLRENRGRSIRTLSEQLVLSKCNNRDLLFKFYSRELIFSVTARNCWVFPDKLTLDYSHI